MDARASRASIGPPIFSQQSHVRASESIRVMSSKTESDRKPIVERDFVADLLEALAVCADEKKDMSVEPSKGSLNRFGKTRISNENKDKSSDSNAAIRRIATNVHLASKVTSNLSTNKSNEKGDSSSITTLREQNEILKQMSALLQENITVRRQRYEKEMFLLKQKVDQVVQRNMQENEGEMASLRNLHRSILDEIAHIRMESDASSEHELHLLRDALGQQVMEKRNEVESLKVSNKNSASEWSLKNSLLEKNLKELAKKVDVLTETNTRLEEKNRCLRVEFEAQADDSVILEKKLNFLKTKNRRLRDFIADCEGEISRLRGDIEDEKGDEAAQTTSASEKNSKQYPNQQRVSSARSTLTPVQGLPSRLQEPRNSHEHALHRLQRLINIESSYLQAVREEHFRCLNERSELEFLFLQTVVQYRHRLRSQHDRKQPSVETFTLSDRRKVIEAFLKNERVLSLLYNTKSTSSPRSDSPRNTIARESVSKSDWPELTLDTMEQVKETEEEERQMVEGLWSKWLSWFHSSNNHSANDTCRSDQSLLHGSLE